LFRLGLGKGLVNFPRNKEEEDDIDVENNETGEKEGRETGSLGLNPAEFVVDVAIIPSSNNTNKTGHGDRPGKKVVELFIALNFFVSLDNHLVEVEGNNTTPAKVGDKKVVADGSTTFTEGALNNSVSKSKHEE